MNTLMKIIYKAILSYTIGVLFVGAGFMLTYLANGNENITKIMLSIGIFDGFLTIGLYAFNGQMLKDESEELRRELLNLPWYNINKQNKSLYTIFLIRSEKPISFDTSLVQMDYLLMVRIFRALYSLSTIVSRAIHFQK
ncbi:hypothetical protein WA026_019763 [Henosepilachna vigintioctopunctata]|uniref:Uncharacterized protein n=1 Tax=Henosepilachna vigintioctopunctata TaxID=420089 RepID=A0AAW1UNZ2_9CUCU